MCIQGAVVVFYICKQMGERSERGKSRRSEGRMDDWRMTGTSLLNVVQGSGRRVCASVRVCVLMVYSHTVIRLIPSWPLSSFQLRF